MDSPASQSAAEGLLVGAVLLAPGSCAWSLLLLRTGSALWDDGPIPTAGLLMCLAHLPVPLLVVLSLVESWRFTIRRPDFYVLIFYGLCFVAGIARTIDPDLLLLVACITVTVASTCSLVRRVARPLRSGRG